MAESTSKTEDTAEKAYAAAAEKAKPAAAKAAPARKAAAKKSAPAKKAPARKPAASAKKAAPKKPVARKTPAPKPAKKPVAASSKNKKTEPTVTQLKEKIMATPNFDFTSQINDTMTEAMQEMQARTQAAYDKGTEAMSEMTDFAKGNVEAVVETGKVFAESMQGMGQTMADEAKLAYETATADIKDMASIKSPTELFQLQGKIMRRNFDAMIAATSKTADATMKMANDVMAPMSSRMTAAAEKISKVA